MTGWGYIVTYEASYMIQFSEYNTTTNLQIVMLFFLAGDCVTALTFRPVITQLGYKYGIVLSMLLRAVGMLTFAYATHLLLVYLAALMAGIGSAFFST